MKLMLKPTLAPVAWLTVLLALTVCGTAASPGPARDAAATPGSIGNGSTGTTVIPVNQEIERDGITVGVTNVTLSGEETLVSYWYDCLPPDSLMYMRGSKIVVDEVQVLEDTGWSGGSGCDSSEIKQLEFAAVPADVETLSFQHGPFWGSDSGELVLEIPIGGQLSELESVLGGDVDLDIVVEFEGLAYRFTVLSARVGRFSLVYQPANEEAKWRPLTGPLTTLFIEDDQGNEFVGTPNWIRWDSEDEFAVKRELIDFEGFIDTEASVWRLRISLPGRVFRGPWHFGIDVPPREVSALAVPTAAPEPTTTAIPKPTLAPRPTPVPGLEPSRLQQAFAMVPPEFADRPVFFADYDGSRVATGLEQFRGPELPQEIAAGTLNRLYEGVPLPDPLRDYTDRLNDLVGLNLFGMDLGVWSLEPPSSSPSFLLMQGVIDNEEIAGSLLDLDYHYDFTGRREALVPVTGSCSPFSTTVVRLESSSVLVGACSVVRGGEEHLGVNGPDLWKWLFDRGEIQFLAQDLDELETAGLQK